MEFQGGDVAFSAKLVAGNWSAAWSDEGVNPAADAAEPKCRAGGVVEPTAIPGKPPMAG